MVKLNLQIPDSFLEEEVRCEHFVSKQIKEIWAIELDLYNELKRVCKKHHLRFAANAGTVLGAVRHKGFIPWDDDLDFAMPREDYDKLCKIAPTEFEHPYHLENFHTEPHYVYGSSKLMNLNTTGYENLITKKHGIFIDIFPLDACVDDKILFDNQWKEAVSLFSQYQRIVTCDRKDYCNEKEISFARRCARWGYHYMYKLRGIYVGCPYHKNLFSQFEKVCQRYNNKKDIKYACEISFLQKNDQTLISDFDNIIEVPFEFTTIPLFPHYDDYLTRKYGDYMKPVKSGYAMHTFRIIDTNRPYTEVLKEKGIL